MKINITLKGKSLADKKRHKLIYQVSCPGEPQKQIETDLAIYKQFWLNKKKKVSTKHPNWDIVNDQIIKYKDEAERLMLEYDLKRISLKGVYTKLKGEISDKSVDQFVNTWTKKNKSDSTFKHYVNCLSSFKNAVGVKGELKFSAIDKSLINKFHRAANDKIRKREWSTVTAKNYMTTFKSICTDAEDEDVIDTPIPFKRIETTSLVINFFGSGISLSNSISLICNLLDLDFKSPSTVIKLGQKPSWHV